MNVEELCNLATASLYAKVDYLGAIAHQATRAHSWLAEQDLGLEPVNRNWEQLQRRRHGAFAVYQLRLHLYVKSLEQCGVRLPADS